MLEYISSTAYTGKVYSDPDCIAKVVYSETSWISLRRVSLPFAL
jgi:hypothetical protein